VNEIASREELARITARLREIATSLRDSSLDEGRASELAHEAAELAATADAAVDEALRTVSRQGAPDDARAEAEE
jgi:hypothetical protein